MRLRRFYYLILYGFSWIFPLLWLRNYMIRQSVVADHEGIQIVDFRVDASNSQGFVLATKAALKIIARNDPRRYRRIKRELRYIVNQDSTVSAYYDRYLRGCILNFSTLKLDPDKENYNWLLCYYASKILHEATHGYLESHYFPYIPATRERIEILCVTEARRFAHRLLASREDLKDKLVPPFRKAEYLSYWNKSWIQRVQEHMELIRSSRKDKSN